MFVWKILTKTNSSTVRIIGTRRAEGACTPTPLLNTFSHFWCASFQYLSFVLAILWILLQLWINVVRSLILSHLGCCNGRKFQNSWDFNADPTWYVYSALYGPTRMKIINALHGLYPSKVWDLLMALAVFQSTSRKKIFFFVMVYSVWMTKKMVNTQQKFVITSKCVDLRSKIYNCLVDDSNN